MKIFGDVNNIFYGAEENGAGKKGKYLEKKYLFFASEKKNGEGNIFGEGT